MRFQYVALNTFRETVRNRVMLNILIFAVGLILFSLIVGDWSMGNQVKVIKDFLMKLKIFSAIEIFLMALKMEVDFQQNRINGIEKFSSSGVTVTVARVSAASKSVAP